MKTTDTKFEIMTGCRGSPHSDGGREPECEKVMLRAGGPGFFAGRVLEITLCACPCHLTDAPEREATMKLVLDHLHPERPAGRGREASPSSVGEPFRHPPV